MSVELWKLFCILRRGRGERERERERKMVFIKSRAANINMTFDISALKRWRWAASYALLSNPLGDSSASQNTAGSSATCRIRRGSLTAAIVPNEKQRTPWGVQVNFYWLIYFLSLDQRSSCQTKTSWNAAQTKSGQSIWFYQVSFSLSLLLLFPLLSFPFVIVLYSLLLPLVTTLQGEAVKINK